MIQFSLPVVMIPITVTRNRITRNETPFSVNGLKKLDLFGWPVVIHHLQHDVQEAIGSSLLVSSVKDVFEKLVESFGLAFEWFLAEDFPDD